MPIREILLQMNSYPEPTPDWAVGAAGDLARRFGAKVAAGLCRVEIPNVSNWLANKLVGASDVIAKENQISRHNASELLERFPALVGAEQASETIVVDCPALVTPWQLAARARVYDLTVVPVYGHRETQAVAEGLVFESGRPVLLLPLRDAAHRLDHVVLAWDGSRAAARALADSLPLCEQASSVALVTVAGEKDLPEAARTSDALRHLASHGIAAEAVEIPADGADAGTALLSFCERQGSDLLVMGAYGHSRVREFVLGGATRSVLQKAKLPVLLAH